MSMEICVGRDTCVRKETCVCEVKIAFIIACIEIM